MSINTKFPGTRLLSEEEQAQWEAAIREVKPYAVNEVIATQPAQFPAEPALPAFSEQMAALPALAPSYKSLSPLIPGCYDGIDAASVRRLKRGKMTIDAKLDLHGYDQAAAFNAFRHQLSYSIQHRHRLLLVITGKGKTGKAILKNALQRWVNHETIRPYLLAFDTARREDGASGAFYIWLKQTKSGR